MRSIAAVSLAAIAVVLTACGSAPTLPPELQYQPPLSTSEVATIRGSEEDVPLLDGFTAYVLAIDGKRVMAGRAGWRTPLSIASGRRRVAVAFQRGVFNAQSELVLEASSGAAYEIRYSTDVRLYGTNSYCDFWVVDLATGKAVTEVRRAYISRSGSASSIYIPIIPARSR